jgi:hypothetical protein
MGDDDTKITMRDDTNIVRFGRYKGQPVEAMAADRGYCDWLLAQPWFREKNGNLYTLIVNNFGEPSETPEHNALQALFLDDDFCIRVMAKAGHILRWKINSHEIALRAFVHTHQETVEQCEKLKRQLHWGKRCEKTFMQRTFYATTKN